MTEAPPRPPPSKGEGKRKKGRKGGAGRCLRPLVSGSYLVRLRVPEQRCDVDSSGSDVQNCFRILRNAWLDSGYVYVVGLFREVPREGCTRTLRSVRDFRECSGIQRLLVRQWIQVCVSPRSSFVFQRNAWFDCGYNLRQSTELFRISALCSQRLSAGLPEGVSTMPVVVLDRCRYRRAENCGAPQLPVVDQVEPSLLSNRDRYAQVQLCSRQLPWLVSPGQLRGSLGRPAHRCRDEGVMSRDMTPGINCIL